MRGFACPALLLLLALCTGAKECPPMICTLDYSPVCGSNGVTYGNKCTFEDAACKADITLAHYGKCKDCNQACTMDWRPVCGSDGKTYGNRCTLDSAACRSGNEITFVHDGECENDCNQACTMDWSPVCGSDGKTYGNRCMLDSAACTSGQEITTVHDGECEKESVDVDQAVLSKSLPKILREKRQAKDCLIPCTRELRPVCGSDGKTYSNKCVLETAACEAGKDITIVHNGRCEDCLMACTMDWRPVCGSDGKTYGNRCMLDSAACRSEMDITVARLGEC